ncbi:hypothetical protein ACFYTC_26865 [Actinomadura nitritigenes]|uniref:hypothetical protein n=1 Tax=Actinomadura nitritigenes TaxID=134602 RepID=UPI0036B519C1
MSLLSDGGWIVATVSMEFVCYTGRLPRRRDCLGGVRTSTSDTLRMLAGRLPVARHPERGAVTGHTDAALSVAFSPSGAPLARWSASLLARRSGPRQVIIERGYRL